MAVKYHSFRLVARLNRFTFYPHMNLWSRYSSALPCQEVMVWHTEELIMVVVAKVLSVQSFSSILLLRLHFLHYAYTFDIAVSQFL